MTIQEKLTTIKNSLSDIKTSIINKGITPTGNITTYSTAIDNIETSVTTINNQDITITQNGTYTAGAGYTGLGTVTVNVTSTTSAELEWTQNDYNSDGTINIAVNDMLTSSVFLASGSIIYTIGSNSVGMVIICDDFSDSNVIADESMSVIIQLTSDLSSNDIITIYNVVQSKDYEPETGEIGINMWSSEYPNEFTKFKNWVANSSTIYSRCKVFLPGL